MSHEKAKMNSVYTQSKITTCLLESLELVCLLSSSASSLELKSMSQNSLLIFLLLERSESFFGRFLGGALGGLPNATRWGFLRHLLIRFFGLCFGHLFFVILRLIFRTFFFNLAWSSSYGVIKNKC